MKALINFCVLKYNIDPEQARKDTESITSLVAYKAFKGKQIALDLQKLVDDNYWTKQEKKQIVVKKRKLVENKEVPDENEPLSGNEFEEDKEKFDDIIGESELDEYLKVKEITEEGWLFSTPYKYRHWRGPHDGRGNELVETVLLKVPQELKILGKVGMSFKGMGFRKRGGIWQPFGLYYNEYVCYEVNK
jgi:hypothetical protein